METLQHCPHAARLRERITKGEFCPMQPNSPRKMRRSVHRCFWRMKPRHQPTFQEAWRAFNNTVNGTINSSQL